jgi:long-chain acyl-CoA synthetase
MRPLVWLLVKPAVVWDAPGILDADEPMLIVANHVTSFDGPLLEYALPGRIRRRIAVAMSGEMLEDYRHFSNPERAKADGRFYPPGPLIYLLLTALFNVFPLPKQRDFQRSFAHFTCCCFRRARARPRENWRASGRESACSQSSRARPCCPWPSAGWES